MNSKGEAGDALRTFCREFGVPEHLTFDGKTQFMSQIRKNDINYPPEGPPQLHAQNHGGRRFFLYKFFFRKFPT